MPSQRRQVCRAYDKTSDRRDCRCRSCSEIAGALERSMEIGIRLDSAIDTHHSIACIILRRKNVIVTR
jgi:hypothetical protein